MSDSIFTRIIKGEIPCHKVYEDERTLAFLDIDPQQEGHVLVIPKVQVEFVWDLGEEDYAALMSSVRKVALRLREVLEPPYVAERVIGTDVPHAHVHLIPFTTTEDLYARRDNGTGPDHPALAALAKKLMF